MEEFLFGKEFPMFKYETRPALPAWTIKSEKGLHGLFYSRKEAELVAKKKFTSGKYTIEVIDNV